MIQSKKLVLLMFVSLVFVCLFSMSQTAPVKAMSSKDIVSYGSEREVTQYGNLNENEEPFIDKDFKEDSDSVELNEDYFEKDEDKEEYEDLVEEMENTTEEYLNRDENTDEFYFDEKTEENSSPDENTDESYLDETNQKVPEMSENLQRTVKKILKSAELNDISSLDAFVHADLNKESKTFYLNLMMKLKN
jgi:hypothetical protein